jgi:hypothetical protein
LVAEQKYETRLKILTGQLTTNEAAAQAGVDRSTIMTLRKVARDGAIAALQASRPGKPRDAREASELARLTAENAPPAGHDRRAGDRVGRPARKISLGLSGPVPQRVPGDVKDKLLAIIDDCVAAGWRTARACAVLGMDRRRVWRWQCRRDGGEDLADRRPGGNAIHGLLDWEIDAIMALAEEWGPIDRSHRKLAHRGFLPRAGVGGALHRAPRSRTSRRRSPRPGTPAAARAPQALARLGRVPAPAGVGLGRRPPRPDQ